MAAASATAGTADPAPAAAPRTHSGGRAARNSADRARMMIRPGTMKQAPPTSAPAGPRSRQAQKMASWVEAGPGSRLVAATPSSNSAADSHSRRSTHRPRSRAMCAGGPPNPMHPIRPHSRAMVSSETCGTEVSDKEDSGKLASVQSAISAGNSVCPRRRSRSASRRALARRSGLSRMACSREPSAPPGWLAWA